MVPPTAMKLSVGDGDRFDIERFKQAPQTISHLVMESITVLVQT